MNGKLPPYNNTPLTSRMMNAGFSNRGLDSLKRYYTGGENRSEKPVVYHNYITMFRPAGGLEYHLIKLSEYKKFPADLHEYYIFYPSECEAPALLATQRLYPSVDYNGNVGFLLQFKIRKEYIATQNLKQLDGKYNQQYWIASRCMQELNNNIFGKIVVSKSFNGRNSRK
jgi:hypothetical protein